MRMLTLAFVATFFLGTQANAAGIYDDDAVKHSVAHVSERPVSIHLTPYTSLPILASIGADEMPVARRTLCEEKRHELFEAAVFISTKLRGESYLRKAEAFEKLGLPPQCIAAVFNAKTSSYGHDALVVLRKDGDILLPDSAEVPNLIMWPEAKKHGLEFHSMTWPALDVTTVGIAK